MAEELLRVLKCDIDGVSSDVVTFYIKHEGQEHKVDLCGKHARCVFEAIHAGQVTSGASGPGKLPATSAAALDRRITD